jgi:SAM-dependent methyltransferase
MTFECNLCGAENEMPRDGFARDAASCARCRSTVRLRALFRALSFELFNAPLPLPDFPTVKAIRGLGMSDNQSCAELLAEKFDYRNTYYHLQPHFDAGRSDPAEQGRYDFVLAGDVFEHVAPPVEAAFRGALDLLKPGGFLAMSVPYSLEETTREHFRDLHEYSVVRAGDALALVNRTRGGDWQVFDDLVFHGGAGDTLELRVFSESSLRHSLSAAGYGRVSFIAEDFLPFGIVGQGAGSLPVIAGKGPFCLSREGIGELATEYLRCKKYENRFLVLSAHLKTVDAELEERTRWSVSLQAHNDDLRGTLEAWKKSRWMHLGHAFGLGPKTPRE